MLSSTETIDPQTDADHFPAEVQPRELRQAVSGQKLAPTSSRTRVNPVDAGGRYIHHEVVRSGNWGRDLRDA